MRPPVAPRWARRYRAGMAFIQDAPRLANTYEADALLREHLTRTFTPDELAARHGLVATAYERRHGARSRTHQLALAYVLDPSTDVYSCPLAMTDGAARTLLDAGNAALVERAVPRLTSRDPARAWTSGQWMTERTGGSDVSGTETVARRDL